MSKESGVVYYAIMWPLANGRDVYNAGKNAIPIPLVGLVAGLLFGGIATLALFLVGWLVGVVNYARSVL